MVTNTQSVILAFIVGTIPALIWLFFWLKEENKNKKEPRRVLGAVFILGMFSVLITIPLQQLIQNYITDTSTHQVLWALIEELIKFLVVIVIVWHTRFLDKPIDWAIYIITSALGFAALENTLFLIEPFSAGEEIVALLQGGLRFLGSTLLHSLSSATIGIALGLSFYKNNFTKIISGLIGILIAVLLHTFFNLFIIKYGGGGFIKISAFLWVVTIIIMLLFERLRRMSR